MLCKDAFRWFHYIYCGVLSRTMIMIFRDNDELWRYDHCRITVTVSIYIYTRIFNTLYYTYLHIHAVHLVCLHKSQYAWLLQLVYFKDPSSRVIRHHFSHHRNPCSAQAALMDLHRRGEVQPARRWKWNDIDVLYHYILLLLLLLLLYYFIFVSVLVIFSIDDQRLKSLIIYVVEYTDFL